MYKLEIINEVTGRSYGSTWEDKSEKDAYLDKLIAKQRWGKNERQINEEDMTEELRARIISTQIIPASELQEEQTIHTVKADYVITETNLNLSKTYRNEQKVLARKAEYRSIEEVMHIILDNGLDSQEYADLQAERAATKAKYPKE
jgi:hypothetical protein